MNIRTCKEILMSSFVFCPELFSFKSTNNLTLNGSFYFKQSDVAKNVNV